MTNKEWLKCEQTEALMANFRDMQEEAIQKMMLESPTERGDVNYWRAKYNVCLEMNQQAIRLGSMSDEKPHPPTVPQLPKRPTPIPPFEGI